MNLNLRSHEDNIFGKTLRHIRQKQGLSLRKLAEMADLDYTYLSKIEAGTVQPPSEEAIIRLATELGEDSDTMLARAGRLHSGLVEWLLSHPEVRTSLRLEMMEAELW